MRALSTIILGFAVFVSGPVSAQEAGQRARLVMAEREGYLLPPPHVVAQAEVRDGKWSSDGQYLLTVRNSFPSALPQGGPPDVEVSVILWSRETRKAQELWKSPSKGGPRGEI